MRYGLINILHLEGYSERGVTKYQLNLNEGKEVEGQKFEDVVGPCGLKLYIPQDTVRVRRVGERRNSQNYSEEEVLSEGHTLSVAKETCTLRQSRHNRNR